MSPSQGGFTADYPHMLDELSVHLAHIILLEKGPGGSLIGGPGCTPGYYNDEGRPNPLAAQGAPYGGGSVQFFKILNEWRNEGSFEALEFSS